MVAQLVVHPWSGHSGSLASSSPAQEPLRAVLAVPDDEEIALVRATMASVSRGTSRLTLSSVSSSLQALLDGLSLLGVVHRWQAEDGVLSVEGRGLEGFVAPEKAIDARGESTVAALLLGVCVSRPFPVEIWVDQVVCDLLLPALQTCHVVMMSDLPQRSFSESGMALHLKPLSQGAPRPSGIQERGAGVFSWVKYAVLLAGLRAQSVTVFEEQWATPDHLERVLLRVRAPLEGHATCTVLHPPRDADAFAPQVYEKIGSTDLALPLICAALTRSRGQLAIRDVGLNPTRTALLSVLRSSGIEAQSVAEGDRQGEPIGRIVVDWGGERSGHSGRGVTVAGEHALRLGDGLIYLSALCQQSPGPWTLRDFFPQARGSDAKIWGRALGLMRSAGLEVDEQDGGCTVRGGSLARRPLCVTSGGDVRLVLLASLLALGASGPSTIDDVDCLRSKYPKWVGTLRALGATLEVTHG